jgi:surfeit locus 1 family protein
MTNFDYGGWRFSLRFGHTLLALLATAAMVMLGNWQTRRAEEKLALQQRFDILAQGPVLSLPSSPVSAAHYVHNRIVVRGEFASQHTVLIDNRVLKGLPGYHVVTPLRIFGGNMHVLVNRGWVAVGPRRDQLPEIRTPTGEVVVEGLAVIPLERVYELGKETTSIPVVQHLVLDRMRVRTALKLQPVVLQQMSDTPDGLVRVWERPDAGVNTHRAYALQWYVMGLMIAVLYFSLNLKRTDDNT